MHADENGHELAFRVVEREHEHLAQQTRLPRGRPTREQHARGGLGELRAPAARFVRVAQPARQPTRVADVLIAGRTDHIDGNALVEHLKLATGEGVHDVRLLSPQRANVPSMHLRRTRRGHLAGAWFHGCRSSASSSPLSSKRSRRSRPTTVPSIHRPNCRL